MIQTAGWHGIVVFIVAFAFGLAINQFSTMDKPKILQSGASETSHSSATDEADEYSVYSVVLNEDRYIDSGTTQMVIRDHTFAGLFDENLQKEIPAISTTTIADYESKNKTSSSLKAQLSLNRKYSLVSEKEVETVFREGHTGWKKFYSKFPGSRGLISLSRVGFDSDRSQALVHVAIGCDLNCGDGQMIFLKKENNKWKVIAKVLTFVS